MVVTDADRAAVDALLEQFRDAWAQMDANAALACFEQGPDTVVVGTDDGEFWHGYEQLIGPFQGMTEAFDHADYRWEAHSPTIEFADDVAWAAGVLHAAFDTTEGRIALAMRVTAGVRRQPDGTWRIRQAHFSVPAAEAVAY